MIREITLHTNQFFSREEAEVKRIISRKLGIDEVRITDCLLTRRSVDARRGRLQVLHKYRVFIDEKAEITNGYLFDWRQSKPDRRVVILGSGPAGLFAALRLLESGIQPVVIERGPDVGTRRKDLAALSRAQLVNPNSNYCFGEGGAGTFSDGKLYTRSRKRGDVQRILALLVHFGAPRQILWDAHPHIGSDLLGGVVERMRNTIISYGGEFHFNTLADGIVLDRYGCAAGIRCTNGEINSGNAVLLATGHSAREVYSWAAHAGAVLEAKTFAVGVRVEHPKNLIDTIQYNGLPPGDLGAASYRLSMQVRQRGVYSFCMCPGGVVVPSASGPEQIVVNGMSPSARNTRWSNAAVVVEIRPEDFTSVFPDIFAAQGTLQEGSAQAALAVQQKFERLAWQHGDRQKAPAQRLVDFLDGRLSPSLPASSYTPGLVSSRLDLWLPEFTAGRLREAFKAFDTRMKGFISEEALLIAVESRTSSPVRMLRSPETYEAAGLKRVFPAGEGAGYAGGIVSSAMDGENAAKALIKRIYGAGKE
ncbi:MAG: FAD-dependent monooxygenase [Spirochaetales bacterium]|jgi:uncharacterized FAD-dependent dehydrogenase|nr:FAD-dependent monooxygenase [Spirochaetales bacterium]